jgi:hypothetical protein
MTHFDPGAYYKDNIQKIWAEIELIPNGDIPAWAEENIAEIEAWEKLENFETVRTPEAIEALLGAIGSRLQVMNEIKDLDEIEQTDKRHREIERLENGRNLIMLKAELLRRRDATIKNEPYIPKKGSRRADTRIIWISRKRNPAELIERLLEINAIPSYISLDATVRAHFFIPSAQTPMLPGSPSRLRWLGHLKVLAFLFEELGRLRYIRKGQLKNVAKNFLDQAGCEINVASFITLPHKFSDPANREVKRIISSFEKIN